MTIPEGQRAGETMHTPWLPCPFCGGTDIRSDAHRFAGTGEHRGETIYSMCCSTCGATFPNRYRHELLKECWNRRVNSHSTLSTENARLTEELSDEKAKHAYTLGTLETEIAERVRLTERVKVLERELAMERVLSIRGTLDAPGAEACINAEIENIRTTLTHGGGK